MKKILSLLALFAFGLGLVACEPLSEQQRDITITFETNNTMFLHPLTFSRGQSLTLPNLQSVGGLLFSGWFLDEDLTQPALDLINRAEDFTLYAKWENTYYDVLIDVYEEVSIHTLFMNDVAMFIIDDEGGVYIQSTKGGESSYIEKVFDLDSDGDILMDVTEVNAFAVSPNGSVYTYGDNTYGQLGTGNKVSSVTFVDITEHFDLGIGEYIIKVVGNNTTAFALSNTGEVYAWGSNRSNLLGDKDLVEALTPRRITDYICGQTDHFLVDIVVTNQNAIALTQRHEVILWGNDASGWFGDILLNPLDHPITITDLVHAHITGHITKMKASHDTFLLVSESQEILVLGNSKLATDPECLTCKPITWSIDNDHAMSEIYIAGDTVLYTLSDFSLWGIGDNTTGLVSSKKGYDYYKSQSDLNVSFAPTVIALSSQEACALDSGEVWCWGTSSSRHVGHSNELILSTRYSLVHYSGENTDYQGTFEDEAHLRSVVGPIQWNAPNALVDVHEAQPYRLYTVVRTHVSAIPMGSDELAVLDHIIRGVCSVGSDDCDDSNTTVHPGALSHYSVSNGTLRWTLEVRVARVEMA